MTKLKDLNKRQAVRHDLYRRLSDKGAPLSQVVKDLRKILGLDQAEFAKLVGQSLPRYRHFFQKKLYKQGLCILP